MPQIRLDALEASLGRGLPAIVWIHGDEALLVIEAADRVRGAARAAGIDERVVFEVDRSFKPAMLAAEAGSMSLFGSRKLIELRLTGKPGKELGEALSSLLDSLDDSVRLMVISGRLDRASTESPWFKALERAGSVVPVYPVERRELPRWIAARLAAQGQRADSATVEFIAERVEGNLLAAHQEVRKLGLLFEKGLLPPAEARSAVMSVARFDAFGLVDAMLAGEAARCRRGLAGLRAEGEAAPLVVWALADTVRALLRLHAAAAHQQPLQPVLRQARVFGPREQLFTSALSRMTVLQLQTALQRLARIDKMIKGALAGDPWQALERLMLGLCGTPFVTEVSLA
jgi:DNA polymerase-3 subunit delta